MARASTSNGAGAAKAALRAAAVLAVLVLLTLAGAAATGYAAIAAAPVGGARRGPPPDLADLLAQRRRAAAAPPPLQPRARAAAALAAPVPRQRIAEMLAQLAGERAALLRSLEASEAGGSEPARQDDAATTAEKPTPLTLQQQQRSYPPRSRALLQASAPGAEPLAGRLQVMLAGRRQQAGAGPQVDDTAGGEQAGKDSAGAPRLSGGVAAALRTSQVRASRGGSSGSGGSPAAAERARAPLAMPTTRPSAPARSNVPLSAFKLPHGLAASDGSGVSSSSGNGGSKRGSRGAATAAAAGGRGATGAAPAVHHPAGAPAGGGGEPEEGADPEYRIVGGWNAPPARYKVRWVSARAHARTAVRCCYGATPEGRERRRAGVLASGGLPGGCERRFHTGATACHMNALRRRGTVFRLQQAHPLRRNPDPVPLAPHHLAAQPQWFCSVRTATSNAHFCGCSLVAPNLILTAAHCIDQPSRELAYPRIDIGRRAGARGGRDGAAWGVVGLELVTSRRLRRRLVAAGCRSLPDGRAACAHAEPAAPAPPPSPGPAPGRAGTSATPPPPASTR